MDSQVSIGEMSGVSWVSVDGGDIEELENILLNVIGVFLRT